MTDLANRLSSAVAGLYRIERRLGEGGMALVYLADDLKHGRKVALKFLKPEVAAAVGAERFLAEIRTTANLQHPHILPLFDSGQAEGILYYAMPYVDGETLREKIDREGQLPVDEAVRIATAVAQALQTAHASGVVHRDVKPGNILLAGDEPVVSDFGIALEADAEARLTHTGFGVGTPYYMSPEQVGGEHEVGPASDVYSLGCVLYEMLVGEPPYVGKTSQAVLSKMIQGEPASVTSIRKSMPLNVDSAVRKSLERIPADRFSSAAAFAEALNDPSFRYGASHRAGARSSSDRWLLPLSVVAAIGFASLFAWALQRDPPPADVQRFESPFARGQGLVDFGTNAFALSSDGSLLVYRGPSAQASANLWVRRWRDLEATSIPGTEGGVTPTISPDGTHVAFSQGGEIRVAAIDGTEILTLMAGHRPMWGEDGLIYLGSAGSLLRVDPRGEAPEVVAELPDPGSEIWPAALLPDHRTILVTLATSDGFEVGRVDVESGSVTSVVEGSFPHYLDSGQLLRLAGGRLVSTSFDPESGVAGEATTTLIESVAAYSMSRAGRLFYSSAPEAGTSEFVWVTRDGFAMPVDAGWSIDTGGGGNIGWNLSPDGSRLAMLRVTAAGSDIWIKELDDGPLSRLTVHPGEDLAPRWSPDGTSVTFISDREVDLEVWERNADGTGDARRILDYDGRLTKAVWSPDGSRLVVRRAGLSGGSEGSRDILVFEPGVDEEPRALVATAEFAEQAPAISPDGRWLAYSSNETGRNEIFVRPFPDVEGGKWQISTAGGIVPVWSRDGTELFFVEDGPRMVAAKYTATSTFRVDRLDRLFDIPPGYPVPQNGDPYDVTADGQRFLMARLFESAGTDVQRAVLVNNFLQEMERLIGR